MTSEVGLRLGIIGIGKIGRTYLTALRAIKDSGLLHLEVTAICDTDVSKAKKIAKDFGIPTIHKQHEDLVNDERVDVVYVCAPTSRHSDIVKSAAQAKKAIFCNKPLAHSAPQVRELNAVTIDSSVKTGAGLVLRYDPFLLYAKKLVEKHDFGKPQIARIRDDQKFPLDKEDYTQWRGEESIPGGGILLEQCVQDIDILTWFFGDISNVYAQVGFFGERGIEDQASLLMKHKNGVQSSIDAVWHSVDRLEERNIEFFFEKGYIQITLEDGKNYLDYHLLDEGPVRIHSENIENVLLDHLGISSKNMAMETLEPLVDASINKHVALNYDFLKSVLSDKTPTPNFQDALSAHQIVDAAYESANKGSPIDVL